MKTFAIYLIGGQECRVTMKSLRNRMTVEEGVPRIGSGEVLECINSEDKAFAWFARESVSAIIQIPNQPEQETQES